MVQTESTRSDLDGLVVVLVRPRNPLNIGAVARAMSNFGVHRLRLVNPYSIAFREARSAVNAADVLRNATEFTTVAEAVADCATVVGTTAVRNRALQHPLRQLDVRSGAAIRKQLCSRRVALLFGSEKIGLTNHDFSHCHWLLRIPTQPDHISMNLAQAVAVCLYEMSRPVASNVLAPEPASRNPDPSNPDLPNSALPNSALPKKKRARNPATSGQAEEITKAMLEALHISGYVKPGTDAVSEKKVRRLMLRLNLEAMDGKVLLGMIRQILWKLRQTRY